ncbi:MULTISPECIES: serine hydrolase [Micromonospora]|uniref:Beta-lactamase n=1 Tax=Micromonospora yangpuensis TaxID=683228 RepID=A0A1C6UGQ6_9ACTN|nr:serine hydrolase [Micromonospora yangpuensis]GGM04568.1 serine hydrolase [Micromonospora yangpuensis]SCL53227.1 Beta-lactamase class A [Micromonospora yangpuensis]
MKVNRRAAIGLGTMATAGTVLGAGTPGLAQAGRPAAAPQLAAAERPAPGAELTATERPAASPRLAVPRVTAIYEAETAAAGGNWQSYVSLTDPAGPPAVAVADEPDQRIEAYSVNKIAVATAVLDKVDRGLLTLAQRVEVTASIVVPGGDGIFSLDGAYPSSVTLGHVLANLLTVSDDTAVRLCGLVCPAAELNAILRAKGFVHTQVEPVANPNRFYLGTSTPRETHDLLRALVGGTLLGATSTAFLLGLLRSPVAFTDGIRRTMSSAERARVATKAGWFVDARHEAGVIFDTAGAPLMTYALFADGQPGADDFGATHPAVAARARMGRRFLDALGQLSGGGRAHLPAPRRPSNGG